MMERLDPGPCFSCGVRTDIDCRHRAGVTLPVGKGAAVAEVKVDRRQFHNAWARNTRDGTRTTADMTAQLKAMLAPKA